MLRLLSPLFADGPTQMATDEALLACAEAPTLRCYSWQPATLSLGYFQDYERVVASLPHPIPIVRRITGGGAIWHEHEVTYALVGTLGEHGLPQRTRDCYPLLHAALSQALGTHTDLQAISSGDRRYSEQPRCFASPAAADVIAVTGGKIVGSAARTRGSRVLIHGSLKLASNTWDGPAVVGCGLDAHAAEKTLVQALSQALGLKTTASTLTADEQAERDRILTERYGTDDWVRHRRGPRA